jgi:hypothetical protein
MSHHLDVGYEKYHFLLDEGIPASEKFQAFRVRHGRFVTKSEKFATEKEADDWIEFQRTLDEDDLQRARTK